MNKKVNLVLVFIILLMMILGCGQTRPKQWSKAKPITGRLDHPNALAADERNIYFVTGGTVASQNEGTNNLMKMPVAGGTPTILFKGGEIIPDADAIALDETHVFFSANGLRKISKEGGASVLLTKAPMVSEIVMDRENVYWKPYVGEGMQPSPIFSISKNGGETKTLTDARPAANGLCADEKAIYWTQTDGIYKTGKQGGSVEKVYSAPAGEISTALRHDAENFYFLQGESNRNLWKLSKSGGQAQQLAKNVSKFWLGEDMIVFQRFVTSFDIALLKIGKDGTGETELDKEGYLSDLIVGKNKIYLSDVVHLYELAK